MEFNDTKPQWFILHSNCIPVLGAARSVIMDVQRESMYYITNELHELLSELKQRPYHEVIFDYDQDSVNHIQKYLSFLEENDLAFWTTDPALFPELNLQYQTPSVVTNAIIDSASDSTHDWVDILEQLAVLGCRDIQLRFYDTVPLSQIEYIMLLLETSIIKSVEIILKYGPECRGRTLKRLTEKYFRIKTITVHNAPSDEIFLMHKGNIRCGMGNIVFLKELIDNNTHCGQISKLSFSFSGLYTLTEAMNFNSCLNRKIAIDINGEIKNCPTLPTVYGNIREDKLAEIIDEELMAIWGIKKDQIETCKVCEYRYACTDCRAFVENKYDKPKKCNYDPFTLSWN